MTTAPSSKPRVDAAQSEQPLVIAPVDPARAEAALGQADDREVAGRRTFGFKRPSRRTFGNRRPSRRTFGAKRPSRRTFGKRGPSRRTFGYHRPSRRTFGARRP